MNKYSPRTGVATPKRGQHTDEVLAEFGFGPDEIADLYKRDIL